MTDNRPLTAGVMGWPITHSKSPLIFEHWFKQHQIPGRYCHLAVRDEDFAEVFRALPKAGFRGVNVTLPHKLNALALADQSTEAARAIGAANMIIFAEDGEIIANNTDGYGFMQNLLSNAPDWKPDSGPAVVLGAGGAARAVLYAMLDAGTPRIRLLNRSRDKAEALADQFGDRITVLDWGERSQALAEAATLINTTSLGMTGQRALEIALDDLPRSALVSDLIYSPIETDLLARASARGNPVVDGLGMLLHQARPAFRTWFGADPTVDETLRRVCLG
ncbi:shikimate dehydrogenase [Rhodobacteraceae bacterium NNCM2]|nr:shikimate dehydrogenase [Coraliihabitans acroporae]